MSAKRFHDADLTTLCHRFKDVSSSGWPAQYSLNLALLIILMGTLCTHFGKKSRKNSKKIIEIF
jgi:hypothetical protein